MATEGSLHVTEWIRTQELTVCRLHPSHLPGSGIRCEDYKGVTPQLFNMLRCSFSCLPSLADVFVQFMQVDGCDYGVLLQSSQAAESVAASASLALISRMSPEDRALLINGHRCGIVPTVMRSRYLNALNYITLYALFPAGLPGSSLRPLWMCTEQTWPKYGYR